MHRKRDKNSKFPSIFISSTQNELIPVGFLLIDGYQNQPNKIEGFLIAWWITLNSLGNVRNGGQ